MTLSIDKQFYLTESLQQHPSAFIVFDKDLKIQWMNNSSRYILLKLKMTMKFRLKEFLM